MKKIYIPISLINVILLTILINKSYAVTNICYITISILLILPICVFEIINFILYKYKKIFIFITVIIITIILLISIYKYSYLMSLTNDLFNLGLKINTLTSTGSLVDFSLILPFYLIIMPLITFVYLIFSKLNLGVIITFLNTAIILLYNFLGYDKEIKFILPLYIFLILINLSLSKTIIELKKNYILKFIIYYTTICIIFSSIIYLFTSYNYTESNGLFNSKLTSIFNRNVSSDFATIGLNTSKVSFLGSKLQINNIKLSYLSGDVPNYLKTKVYYDYNYNRWIEDRSLPYVKSKNTLDADSLIKDDGLNKKNIDFNKKNGTKIKTFSIDNLDNNFADVMMSPNYITKVVCSNNSNIYMYNNENYLTGNSQNNYTISYYDYSDTETTGVYSDSPYKDDINNLYTNKNKNSAEYKTIESSLKFASSERVKELAEKITSGASNNNRKLKLIQNYLLSNYKYSLQPNPINTNSPDYVDFFLFNEKKGYCKSFAAAAVMLCRAVNIPARYVEGFKVRGEVDNRGRYIIRSYDAHAWAEVLTSADKGIWSILETTPTPDYENSAANDPETTIPETNNIDRSIDHQDSRTNTLNKDNNIDKNNNPSKESVNENQNNNRFSINNFTIKLKSYKYLIASILIISILFLIKYIRRKVIVNKLLKSTSSKLLYIFVLKRLRTIKITKLSYETDKEFALRIKNISDIEPLVEGIYKEVYGNEISILDRKSIIKDVEAIVKKNSNIFNYYMFY